MDLIHQDYLLIMELLFLENQLLILKEKGHIKILSIIMGFYIKIKNINIKLILNNMMIN
jgi:hypothetical protein